MIDRTVYNKGNKNTYLLRLADLQSEYITVLLENKKSDVLHPYTLAIGFDDITGTWQQGRYYQNFNDAKKAFIEYIK